MQVIYYPDDAKPARWHQPILALGNFDGMHRGHLKIIERVRRVADERSATAVAMTFVRTVLLEWLHVSEVWVGANFLFGHDRTGNFSMLRSLGARYGFRGEKIDPVRYKDFVVSSTRIRRLITEGRVDEAGALLGHHYTIEGPVVRGRQRGKGLGFPTANICSENELIPPGGVYATTAIVNGVAYPSITNIGTRPTFEAVGENVIETHLLDFDRDLYGTRIKLAFVQRLRDEKKFEAVDALTSQIETDRSSARDLFDRMGL